MQPVASLAAVAHEFGVPFHTDAVQAAAQLPVDFAASGADAMTVTAHKLGGPVGVGALILGKGLAPVPVLHGGGQERDIRSGTLDAPAIRAFAVAAVASAERRSLETKRIAALRDDLIRQVLLAVPDAVLNGPPPGPDRLPGNAHFSFPGCEGDALLLLLDAKGIACSTGSACTAGVAEPSHVLLAMGADDTRARGSLRFSLGHTTTQADVDALGAAIGEAAARARRAAAALKPRLGRLPTRGTAQGRIPWKWLWGLGFLPPCPGGVDSATAAARAVDAGHEVTGVHLALSSNPQSYRTGARGCCTIEDARDARRAADVIGIPFYVWDMAERFARDVVDDFVAEYAAGRTPNPCLRCNEKIKFAAVLDRALALGFDAVCTGHYAQISDGALQRAVDPGKDQSYVLAVLTKDQIAHAIFPLGDTPKSQVREEARSRGLLVADKPDSHDVCFIADGDTRGFLSRKLGSAPGSIVDQDGAVLGTHDGVPRLHHRPAQGPAPGPPRPRRQPPLRPVHRAGVQHGNRRPGRRPRRPRDHRDPPGLDRLRAPADPDRVHGPAPRPRRGPPLHRPGIRRRAAHLPHRPGPRRGRGPGRGPLRRRHGPRQRHHLRHPLNTHSGGSPGRPGPGPGPLWSCSQRFLGTHQVSLVSSSHSTCQASYSYHPHCSPRPLLRARPPRRRNRMSRTSWSGGAAQLRMRSLQ